MTTLRENYGFNRTSESVLDGTYEFSEDLSEEVVAFLTALRRTDKERECPPILGAISSTEFQAMFKVKKERTSSDTRTLNYTLWKCLAHSNYLSSIMSIMISLPFTYGFVNTCWSKMTDFMIEKKPGLRQIHRLRIIGKVAAEFNTALSYLIGKQTSANYESCDPCGEQHGSRPNMGSADAAMLKVLTFESARMQRTDAAFMQHDCSAHFDRIYPENTSVFATKYGVDKNILTSVAKTVESMERHVKTGLGYYGNGAGKPRLNRMVQGKADVPQLATQQSDVCMRAHHSLAPGLVIEAQTVTGASLIITSL